jgi:hypothetical protein
MAINEYMLSHKDLVKAVIVHRNIHEGFWCLNINFNIAASHGVESPNPSVALSIMSIGITRSPEANELTVDAAVVNPWIAKPVEEPVAPPPPPAAPRPAAPTIATNAEILAALPSRFSRNIYGNVAVSFRPGAAQQGRGANGDAPPASPAANGSASPNASNGSGANGVAAEGIEVKGAGLNGAALNGSGANGIAGANGANGASANGAGSNGPGANGVGHSNGHAAGIEGAPDITLPPQPPHGNA